MLYHIYSVVIEYLVSVICVRWEFVMFLSSNADFFKIIIFFQKKKIH